MRAIVVGAGIGGLCVARSLQRGGNEVVVLERASSLGEIQVGGAIHVWHNGMRGLQRLGLGERIEQLGGRGAVVDHMEMRTWNGRLITSWPVWQAAQELGAPTVGVLRPDLHRVLVDGVAEGTLRLGSECTDFEQHEDRVVVRLAHGGEEEADALIGADGLRSAVRRRVLGDEPPRFAGYASWQAVADFQDDATPIGLFRVVWGRGARFLFYRISDERLYWEGTFATEPGGTDPPGARKQAVGEKFSGWHHPVQAIIEATEETAITRADSYDRPPAKRWGEGRITLLGDAAHAMTNAAGQGANQTIEDAVVLGDSLAADTDPEAGLRAYEAKRIPRTTSVNKLAWSLSSLSRLSNPAAVMVRDAVLTAAAPVARRIQHKDMAYEF